MVYKTSTFFSCAFFHVHSPKLAVNLAFAGNPHRIALMPTIFYYLYVFGGTASSFFLYTLARFQVGVGIPVSAEDIILQTFDNDDRKLPVCVCMLWKSKNTNKIKTTIS